MDRAEARDPAAVSTAARRQHLWRVAHASRTGTRHQRGGQECQDHSCFVRMPRLDGTLVAAVADGLGSAYCGREGAVLASEAAVTELSQRLFDENESPPRPERMETMLNAAVLWARIAVEERAEALCLPLQELSTTLLLAVLTGDMVATAQIGDGAAVISEADGSYRTLAVPQRGEYANETVALTSRRALQQCEISIARTQEPISTLALMTDGLLNLSMDMSDATPHRPFFDSLSNWLRTYTGPRQPSVELSDTLGSETISRRTDDDVTLLIAVRDLAL